MPDLEQRMRGIDRLPVPDLLDRAHVEARTLQTRTGPPPVRRLTTVAAAVAVSVAALVFLWTALRPDLDEQPPLTPAPVGNGDIWVWVGGYGEPSAIFRVAPQRFGTNEVMWTDDPDVFDGGRYSPERLANDFAFSPDGGRVAFTVQLGRNPLRSPREVFVMNVDGTGLRQLTNDGAYASHPAWSPDGTTIAYTWRSERFNPTDIYTVNVDGGASTPLFADESTNEMDPSWSPDGTQITFAVVDIHGPDSIVTTAMTGGDLVTIATGRVSRPTWSPDGRSIAFLRLVDGTERIWVSATDGSAARELADTGKRYYLTRPVWAPDGSSIAFARIGETSSLVLIPQAGDAAPLVVARWSDEDVAPMAWQPVPPDPGSPQGEDQGEATT